MPDKMPKKPPTLIKRFKVWARLKRKINDSVSIPSGYKERDVWWVAVGHKVGVEEDGKGEFFNRPVLIVKGFSKYQFWGVPLSTTKKTGKYYHPFVMNGKVSTALLSQLRVFDTRRFINIIGVVDQKNFAEIKQKLIEYLS
jgi:mRNA interferase MazF